MVLAALTSKTLLPHVAVSPFREISFLAVKVAKEHSILDPKNDTSKLSLNQTLGPVAKIAKDHRFALMDVLNGGAKNAREHKFALTIA